MLRLKRRKPRPGLSEHDVRRRLYPPPRTVLRLARHGKRA